MVDTVLNSLTQSGLILIAIELKVYILPVQKGVAMTRSLRRGRYPSRVK